MIIQRTTIAILCATVSVIVLAGVTHAAVMPPKSLNELADESTVICTCRVVDQQSQWDTEQNMIVTLVTLQVEEYLKGTGGQELTVEALGGIVGDKGLKVTGAPVFELGERAVLFLKAAENNRHHVVGWAQGKFTVRTDPNSGEERIERSLKDVHLTTPEVPGGPQEIRTLSQLKAAIRAIVTPPAKNPPAP
jgi:hypothetical protein